MRSWRTLIRFNDIGDDTVSMFIPSWNSEVAVERPRSDIPVAVIDAVYQTRMPYAFAMVPIGADSADLLTFDGWEPNTVSREEHEAFIKAEGLD